jgi:endonuclease III
MTVTYPADRTAYLAQIKAQYERIYPILTELYPDPLTALDFKNPFELVIATLMSAQTTDKQVNLVTPGLFARFPTPQAMAEAEVSEVEQLINRIGMYRNKAKNIVATAKILVEKFGGAVPQTMEELITLPGVARKTANVVLGNAFNTNVGIAVDTHVTRLAGRLGLSKELTPEKIEKDLMNISPSSEWTNVSHRLIWHGRLVCQARKPLCANCTLADLCPSVQNRK